MQRKKHTTERGVTIEVMPIPLFLDKIRKAHAEPKRPVYIAETVDGPTEMPHNETTLTTDEDRAAWAAYLAAKEAGERELNDRIQRAVFAKAIIFKMPEDDGWIAEQEEYGIAVPTDPAKRRLHYIETEVIGGPVDIVKITALANGVEMSEEALQAAQDSFQRILQGNATEAIASQARAVAG